MGDNIGKRERLRAHFKSLIDSGTTKLDIRRQHLSDDAFVEVVLPVLEGYTHITWLDLSFNSIGDVSFDALAAFLAEGRHQQVKDVYLHNTSIASLGLTRFVSTCSKILPTRTSSDSVTRRSAV